METGAEYGHAAGIHHHLPPQLAKELSHHHHQQAQQQQQQQQQQQSSSHHRNHAHQSQQSHHAKLLQQQQQQQQQQQHQSQPASQPHTLAAWYAGAAASGTLRSASSGRRASYGHNHYGSQQQQPTLALPPSAVNYHDMADTVSIGSGHSAQRYIEPSHPQQQQQQQQHPLRGETATLGRGSVGGLLIDRHGSTDRFGALDDPLSTACLQPPSPAPSNDHYVMGLPAPGPAGGHHYGTDSGRHYGTIQRRTASPSNISTNGAVPPPTAHSTSTLPHGAGHVSRSSSRHSQGSSSVGGVGGMSVSSSTSNGYRMSRTSSAEFLDQPRAASYRVSTPVSVMSEPNAGSNGGSASCLHCSTLRRTTGVHQTTQTTGPISPQPNGGLPEGGCHSVPASPASLTSPQPPAAAGGGIVSSPHAQHQHHLLAAQYGQQAQQQHLPPQVQATIAQSQHSQTYDTEGGVSASPLDGGATIPRNAAKHQFGQSGPARNEPPSMESLLSASSSRSLLMQQQYALQQPLPSQAGGPTANQQQAVAPQQQPPPPSASSLQPPTASSASGTPVMPQPASQPPQQQQSVPPPQQLTSPAEPHASQHQPAAPVPSPQPTAPAVPPPPTLMMSSQQPMSSSPACVPYAMAAHVLPPPPQHAAGSLNDSPASTLQRSSNAQLLRIPQSNLSCKQRAKEYVRRETAKFFGVPIQDEEYERTKWEDRQRRFACRRFGSLRDDYDGREVLVGPGHPGDGGAHHHPHHHHHHHHHGHQPGAPLPPSDRPDILPAQSQDERETELSRRQRANPHYASAQDRQGGDVYLIRAERKPSVPAVICSGLRFLVQSITRRRLRTQHQWSRSFAPAHVELTGTDGADGSEVHCDGLAPLQDGEAFFDTPTAQIGPVERAGGQQLQQVHDNSRQLFLLRPNLLDERYDYRPFFTYWINTVQIVVMILSLICYGFGPIGLGMEYRSAQVLVTSLSLQQVHHQEPRNIWIGLRSADLIHLGAKYGACMRRDTKILDVVSRTRKHERETACCIRNDDSGCVQSSQADCSIRGWPSKTIATWKKWSPGESGPGGRISGSVCGLDPKYCDAPASIAPHEWPDDITKWPICRKNNQLSQRFRFKDHTAEHMVCEVIGHPCCIGVYGECRITTREYCDFVHGYFHEEASLCSQVSCLNDVCGMFHFMAVDYPDQFYRLFTSLLLHAGLIHLIVSVAFQHLLLADLERLIGPLRTAILYIGSGIAGNLTSAIFVPYKAEVGPLPSIAGVLASLMLQLVLCHWKSLKKPHLAMIKLLTLGCTLFGLGTLPLQQNFTGLIAGLLTGIALTLAFVPFVNVTKHSRKSKINLIWTCVTLQFVLYAVMFIIFYAFPTLFESLNFIDGNQLLDPNAGHGYHDHYSLYDGYNNYNPLGGGGAPTGGHTPGGGQHNHAHGSGIGGGGGGNGGNHIIGTYNNNYKSSGGGGGGNVMHNHHDYTAGGGGGGTGGPPNRNVGGAGGSGRGSSAGNNLLKTISLCEKGQCVLCFVLLVLLVLYDVDDFQIVYQFVLH
uniref:Peptidase S54 rhomboid domain-containing protein n=1 Tax=Anopheles coluzzii TaxID=1518534 RepID=A0A8W7PTV9_ANOCL